MASQEQREQKQIERVQIVVDQVADYLAQKMTKTQIFNKLRGVFPDIKRRTVRALIRAAGKDIMARYGISPEEYKGEQIAFYEYVLRGQSYDKDGCKASVKERLAAAERLDKLFNLENIVNSDPADKAAQIIEFLKQADATVGSGIDPNKVVEDKDDDEIPKANGTAEPGAADNQGRTATEESGRVGQARGQNVPEAKDDTGDDLDEDGDVLEEFGNEVV